MTDRLRTDELETSPGAGPTFPPLPADPDAAFGAIAAELGKLTRQVGSLRRDYGTVTRELTQLRKDIELDRGALVAGASSQAAKHSSNRTAALMGTLFTLYEISSPYLHELWRLVHQ